MKTHLRLLFIPAILLLATISSCSMNGLTMSVTEPAPVTLDPAIEHVGIINRSMPSEEYEELDKIDKVLSLEGKELDKKAGHAAMMGLFDELTKNDRFATINTLDTLSIDNPGLGVFPAPLSWSEVQKIGHEQGVDILFVLSFYDTDTRVDYKMVPVEVSTPIDLGITLMEHQATVNTLIKTGWRIYDVKNKLILDEYVLYNKVVTSGRGINPVKAAKAALDRDPAVMQTSTRLGEQYAWRILPYRIRVSRDYYVKGSNNFKIGKRRAQTGDWNGAAEKWEEELYNPKRKVAGRAHYNMAIINEINGDLDAAIEWASKAYTDYKNKEALDYLRVLKRRAAKNQQVKNQMNY